MIEWIGLHLIFVQTCAMFTLNCSALQEQEKQHEIRMENELVTIFNIEPTGKVGMTWQSKRKLITPLPILELILDDNTGDFLELSKSQKQKLNSVKKRLHRRVSKAMEKLEEPFLSHKKEVKILNEVLSNPFQEARTALKEGFAKVQHDQLTKVFAVLSIRRIGLANFLQKKMSVKKLNLSKEQIAKIQSHQKTLLQQYQQKSKEQKKQAVKELMKLLESNQKQKLTEIIGNLERLSENVTPIFIWQLEHSNERNQSEVTLAPSTQWLLPLALPGEFEVQLNGSFHFQSRGQVRSWDIELVDELLLELYSPEFQKELEFTPTQVEQWKQIFKKRNQFFEDRVKEINQNLGFNTEGKIHSRKNWIQRQKQHFIQLGKEMKFVLNPIQQKQLNQFLQRMAIQRTGISYQLTAGKLFKELKISHDQKKKILERSRKLATSLKQKQLILEKELNKNILSVLNKEQQKRFRTMIARDMKLEAGNMEIAQMLSFDQSYRRFERKFQRQLQFCR